MAIPGNMWIYDDGGALIKGGCDVKGREYSIELKVFITISLFQLIMQRVNQQAHANIHR